MSDKKSTRDQAFSDRAEGQDQTPTDDDDRGQQRTTPARFLYPAPGPHGKLGTTG